MSSGTPGRVEGCAWLASGVAERPNLSVNDSHGIDISSGILNRPANSYLFSALMARLRRHSLLMAIVFYLGLVGSGLLIAYALNIALRGIKLI